MYVILFHLYTTLRDITFIALQEGKQILKHASVCHTHTCTHTHTTCQSIKAMILENINS